MGTIAFVLLAVLVAGAIAHGLGFSLNAPRRIALFLAAALVFVPALYLLNIFTVHQLVGGYVSEIAAASGMSSHLAKALSVALVLPALLGLALLFSPSSEGRLGYYYGTLWLATKEQLITRQGEPLKCYVLTEEGVSYKEIRDQGLDQTTGRRCDPVTSRTDPAVKQA